MLPWICRCTSGIRVRTLRLPKTMCRSSLLVFPAGSGGAAVQVTMGGPVDQCVEIGLRAAHLGGDFVCVHGDGHEWRVLTGRGDRGGEGVRDEGVVRTFAALFPLEQAG